MNKDLPKNDMPPVFQGELEEIKPIARAKRKAAKDFKWTRRYSLEDTMLLAYWLYIFDRKSEAMEICRFLAQAQFTGDVLLWVYVEGSLALQARLLRHMNHQDEAKVCIKRIETVMIEAYEPGTLEFRLQGNVLESYETNANLTQRDMRKPDERIWHLQALIECCTLIELGGSAALPIDVLEEHVREHKARLREIA